MSKGRARRFEMKDAQHDKFWQIEVSGSVAKVRFGRRGRPGVEKTTQFEAPAEAELAAAKLVEEKVKKGYREVGAGGESKPAKATRGVNGLLGRLSALWAEKRPRFEKRLRPGASAAALAKFKTALGLKLPPEFLAFYAWHDGSRNPNIDQLESPYGWLPLANLQKHKTMLDTMGFEDEDTYPKYFWSPAWVPFLGSDGDLVCLDTRSGVVFKHYNSQRKVVLLAPSFGAWLTAHVALTEAALTMTASSDDETWQLLYDAFNGLAADRIRKRLSSGFPKTLETAKTLF
jgi:predicted DNA-binding WGR domain protein/cell wall assembly regulator SMI1